MSTRINDAKKQGFRGILVGGAGTEQYRLT